MVFCHAPIPRKGLDNQQQQQLEIKLPANVEAQCLKAYLTVDVYF